MTADIRTAAQREAELHLVDRIGESPEWFKGSPSAQGFIMGAGWGAARVTPTREQIAEAIHNALPDSMNGECYQWPAMCIDRGGSCVALADAVLKLIQDLTGAD